MLGSAVSSSTPRDFQSSSHIGVLGSRPLMNCHVFVPGPTMGCPYMAVGMQRALDSAIGLPRRSTSASWMLAFLMPADVRRSLMLPPGHGVGVVVSPKTRRTRMNHRSRTRIGAVLSLRCWACPDPLRKDARDGAWLLLHPELVH